MLVLGAGLGAGASRAVSDANRAENEVTVSWAAVYLAVGAALVGIGVGIEILPLDVSATRRLWS